MSRHRIFFVATLLLFPSLTLALTFDRPLVSAALAAESGTTQAAGAGTIFWTDSIQAGASPWGLPLGCAHPISTPVPCSDANGANVSVVPDPAGGPGKAMRHYMDVSNGGGRAQAGTMTFMNPAMAAHFATHSDIWIEEEVFIPTNFVSTGVGPWISIMDFHSVGANRWHTDPGLFMCSSVNGCAAGDIGKLAARNYQGTIFAGPSTMPVPINQWFKLQVHWIWSTTPVPITYYINGVQVLQIVAPTKEGPDQTTVEWYNKFYGDDAGGSWTPNPMVRYTRNIMFSDAMIGGTTPPPRHNRSLHTSRPHRDASPIRYRSNGWMK